MTGVLNGFERLAKPVQVLLIGDPADETIVAMQGRHSRRDSRTWWFK